MLASLEQIETMATTLKKKGWTPLQIYCFMVKSDLLPDSVKDWKKEVVLSTKYYGELVQRLIELC